MNPGAAGSDDQPPPRTARRRVFFALWPGDAARQAILRATRDIVRHSGGKPTPRENLHITLAFLGPLTAEDLAKVSAVSPPPAQPFELVLDRVGLWSQSQVLWVAPSEIPAPLGTLERQLWDRLVALGFSRETRPFLPHLTVARKAQGARGRLTPVAWQVDGIALVESKTGPRNSRYTVLESWAF